MSEQADQVSVTAKVHRIARSLEVSSEGATTAGAFRIIERAVQEVYYLRQAVAVGGLAAPNQLPAWAKAMGAAVERAHRLFGGDAATAIDRAMTMLEAVVGEWPDAMRANPRLAGERFKQALDAENRLFRICRTLGFSGRHHQDLVEERVKELAKFSGVAPATPPVRPIIEVQGMLTSVAMHNVTVQASGRTLHFRCDPNEAPEFARHLGARVRVQVMLAPDDEIPF